MNNIHESHTLNIFSTCKHSNSSSFGTNELGKDLGKFSS